MSKLKLLNYSVARSKNNAPYEYFRCYHTNSLKEAEKKKEELKKQADICSTIIIDNRFWREDCEHAIEDIFVWGKDCGLKMEDVFV